MMILMVKLQDGPLSGPDLSQKMVIFASDELEIAKQPT
jgi:hypothetical protein